MNEKLTEIVTPCISVCKTDPITNYCYGCGRDSDDKKMWNDPSTSNQLKEDNLKLIRSRLSGWQGIAFDKSYSYKKENKISLIKKKILEQKEEKNVLDPKHP